jgi:thioredoxin-disulfide reductase
MTDYDVIIIGGGCAGLAAALYAKRYDLRVAVFAKELGGLITTTHIVENYPGIRPMSGWDMMDIFIDQMKTFDVKIIEKNVDTLKRNDDSTYTITVGEDTHSSKTIIFSTGTYHRHLEVPGEEEYANKGLSYCATCDGALHKGKKMVIAGGGDSASKEALLLSDYAEHVYIIARSTLKPEPINGQRVRENDKITVIEHNTISQVCGDGSTVTHVMLNNEYEGSTQLDIGAVFVAIGHIAQTELATDIGVEMNKKGEILIDKTSRTNLAGFYAAGDCTDTAWKQAIISAAEGSQAANSAYEDLTANIVRPK